MNTNPQPIGDAFQRAVEHWRSSCAASEAAATGAGSPAPLTVAISREAASGGRRIAAALAAMLEWPIYDRELVDQIAKDSGFRSDMIESVDEHRGSFLLETLEAFTGAPTLGGAGYAHRLTETLAGLGAHGDCVIVGRGATAMLPPETTIAIRIVASQADRMATHCERQGISQREAKSQLKRIDRERADFVKQYFHQHIDDPHIHDLVINTSRLADEECVQLILSVIRQRQLAD